MSSSRRRVHGGPLDDELAGLGIDPAAILDFSVSTNPYGPCPAVIECVRVAAIDRYPDPTSAAVRRALAPGLGCTPAELTLGNGAADLLWTLARALVRPGQAVVVVEPTFGELAAAAATIGARLCEWRAGERDGFAIDLDAIAARVTAERARLVYLCAPNTPTGAGVAAAEVAVWARALPQALVLLDQSFLSLSEAFADAGVAMPANVIRLRSLTKEHAIPGIRVGYAIAPPEIVALVEASRPAWTTSSLAQAAALASTSPPVARFVAESREKILADRARLERSLRALGVAPAPSTAGFLLVPWPRAGELRDRLLRRHQILVRDCASFGLPGHLRLAARPAADRERLCDALTEEMPRC